MELVAGQRPLFTSIGAIVDRARRELFVGSEGQVTRVVLFLFLWGWSSHSARPLYIPMVKEFGDDTG